MTQYIGLNNSQGGVQLFLMHVDGESGYWISHILSHLRNHEKGAVVDFVNPLEGAYFVASLKERHELFNILTNYFTLFQGSHFKSPLWFVLVPFTKDSISGTLPSQMAHAWEWVLKVSEKEKEKEDE